MKQSKNVPELRDNILPAIDVASVETETPEPAAHAQLQSRTHRHPKVHWKICRTDIEPGRTRNSHRKTNKAYFKRNSGSISELRLLPILQSVSLEFEAEVVGAGGGVAEAV